MTKSNERCPGKLDELVMFDYKNRMIALANGSNIHRVKNLLQGVIGDNIRGLYAEREEKMKRISKILQT